MTPPTRWAHCFTWQAAIQRRSLGLFSFELNGPPTQDLFTVDIYDNVSFSSRKRIRRPRSGQPLSSPPSLKLPIIFGAVLEVVSAPLTGELECRPVLMQKLSAATHTETNGPAEPLVTAGYAEWEVRRFNWLPPCA